MKETKESQFRNAVKNEDFKTAFKIYAKSFTRQSKDNLRIVQIANECNSGKSNFYKQLGYDIDLIGIQAKEICLGYLV